MGDGKTSRLYRKQRLAFRAQGQADNEPCWICGMEIDYRLDHTDPEGWHLDHPYPTRYASRRLKSNRLWQGTQRGE